MITHPLAGPSRRFVAYLIDLVLLAALVFAAFVLSVFASMGSPSGFGPARFSPLFVDLGLRRLLRGRLQRSNSR